MSWENMTSLPEAGIGQLNPDMQRPNLYLSEKHDWHPLWV